MGVHGLWKLIDSSGKPVPIETLENKILAVDVSIWLHQVVKGFQDSRGNPLPNAHLLGLFHRICKLLFYKIRPVFVFDGGVPHLKKQTVAARRQLKNRAEQDAEQAREKLLKNFIKHKAVKKALGDKASHLLLAAASSSSRDADMFHLPETVRNFEREEEEEEKVIKSEVCSENENSEDEEDALHGKYRLTDLHTIDVGSAEFKSLPANIRHDILSELKETRKQSSWGRLHEIPKESNDFSSYQMNRLLKRRSVQVSLEEAEKEMGGRTLSLGELEELLKDQGVSINTEVGQRIASDNVTRFVYMKESLLSSPEKKKSFDSCSSSPEKYSIVSSEASPEKKLFSGAAEAEVPSVCSYKSESTGTLDNVISQERESNSNKSVSIPIEMEDHFTECAEDDKDIDDNFESSDDDSSFVKHKPEFQLAHSFMFENSGLTQKQILKIIKGQKHVKTVCNIPSDLSAASTSKDTNCASTSKDTNCASTSKDTNCASTSKDMNCTPTYKDINCASTSKDMNCTPTYKDINCASTSKDMNCTLTSKDINCASTSKDMNCTLTSKDINCASSEDTRGKPSSKYVNCLPAQNNTNCKSTYIKVCPNDEIYSHNYDSDDDCESSGLTQHEIFSLIKNDNNVSQLTEALSEEVIHGKTKDKKGCSVGTKENNLCIAPAFNYENTYISEKSNENNTVHSEKCSETESNDRSSILVVHNRNVIEKGIPEKSVSLNEFESKKINENMDLQIENLNCTKAKKQNNLEILINCEKNNSLEDDIFADVFADAATVKMKTSNDDDKINIFRTEEHNTEKTIVNESSSVDIGVIESSEESESDDDADESVENKSAPSSDSNITEEGMKVPVSKPEMTVDELLSLQDSLEQKHADLLAERGKQERLAASITDQMVLEAQELLQLFGIPYIVAPMEAEAQCAFLDAISLTEGTITDDSDIWLFGGRVVYKNFFSMKKEVMQFRFTDIYNHFRLTREQLVLLALLVGSDYTVGLQGVGPVTALEILAAFPADTQSQDLLCGLKKFNEWLKNGRIIGPGKTVLRNKLKNVTVMQGFPNHTVVNAYLHPEVDESSEKFSWASPDLKRIKEYTISKFGWTAKKSEEILMPVMKKLSESKHQRSLDSYFRTLPQLDVGQEKMSKRVRDAIRVIANEDSSDVDDPEPKRAKPTASVVAKKQSRRPRKIAETNTTAPEPGSSTANMVPSPPTLVIPKFVEQDFVPGVKEFIPQREQDKLNSLQNKLKAIETFRKSKRGLDRTKRETRKKRQILKEAALSESSSDDN